MPHAPQLRQEPLDSRVATRFHATDSDLPQLLEHATVDRMDSRRHCECTEPPRKQQKYCSRGENKTQLS
jgi:hypothetical protein